MEISDYADRYIRDQLQNLPGVSEVRIFGERRYSMRIWVDRARLVAHNLTVQDVEDALRQQNVEVPSGRIESLDREFTVLSRTGMTTPEQFRRIVVKDVDGFSVYLGDLAKVQLGPQTSGAPPALRARPQRFWGSSSRRPPIRSTCHLPSGRSCRRSSATCRLA